MIIVAALLGLPLLACRQTGTDILIQMLAPSEFRDAVEAKVRPAPLSFSAAALAKGEAVLALNRSLASFEALSKEERRRAMLAFVAWCEMQYQDLLKNHLGPGGGIQMPRGRIAYQVSKLDFIAFVQGTNEIFDRLTPLVRRATSGYQVTLAATGDSYDEYIQPHYSPVDIELVRGLVEAGYFDDDRRGVDTDLLERVKFPSSDGMDDVPVSQGERILIQMPAPFQLANQPLSAPGKDNPLLISANRCLRQFMLLPAIERRQAVLDYTIWCFSSHKLEGKLAADAAYDVSKLDLVSIAYGAKAHLNPFLNSCLARAKNGSDLELARVTTNYDAPKVTPLLGEAGRRVALRLAQAGFFDPS